MFLASNGRFAELDGLDTRQTEMLKRLVNERVAYGLGPRAVIALMLGAKAWSLMFLENAEYAEGPALGRVVIPVLRHRIKLDFDWEDRYCKMAKQDAGSSTHLLETMLKDFCLLTAPTVSKENIN